MRLKEKKMGENKFPSAEEYKVFYIPKRTGGKRKIEAPSKELLKKQRKALKELRRLLPVSPFAHGFVRARNIVTAAAPHTGKRFISKIDVKDFFPSITWENFCTELEYFYERHDCKRPIEEVKDLLSIGFINDGEKIRLPQGGALSPFISNVYLARFDWIAARKAQMLSCEYTRYADDIIVSSAFSRKDLTELRAVIYSLLKQFNLSPNLKKRKNYTEKKRVIILGLSVGLEGPYNKPRLPKAKRRRLRLLNHLKEKGAKFSRKEEGEIAYYRMVHVKKYKTMGVNEIFLPWDIEKAI